MASGLAEASRHLEASRTEVIRRRDASGEAPKKGDRSHEKHKKKGKHGAQGSKKAEADSENEAESSLMAHSGMSLHVLGRRMALISEIRRRANEVATPKVMIGYFEFLTWAGLRGFRVKLLLGSHIQDL